MFSQAVPQEHTCFSFLPTLTVTNDIHQVDSWGNICQVDGKIQMTIGEIQLTVEEIFALLRTKYSCNFPPLL